MKYYSEKDLNEVLDVRDRRVLRQTKIPIEISFCRDCELFEIDYWQPNPEIQEGWCRGRSYYRTYDDEYPHYVYTNSNSFCDKRTVNMDGQFIYSFINCYISYVV